MRVGGPKVCSQCGKKKQYQRGALIEFGRNCARVGLFLFLFAFIAYWIAEFTRQAGETLLPYLLALVVGPYALGTILIGFAEILPGTHVFRCSSCGSEETSILHRANLAFWIMGTFVGLFVLFLFAMVAILIFYGT